MNRRLPDDLPFPAGAAAIVAAILALTAPLIELVSDSGPGLHPYTITAIILAPPLLLAGRLPRPWADGAVAVSAVVDIVVLAFTSPETVPGGLVRPAAILPLWIVAILIPRPWIAASLGAFSLALTAGIGWGMPDLASALVAQGAGAGLAVALCYGGRRSRQAVAQQSLLQAKVTQRNIERQAIARFVRHAAHELRTPLTPLRLLATSLRLQGDDEMKRSRSLEQMERQVGRLTSIVDRLATLASVGPPASERQDLAAAVRRAAKGEDIEAPDTAWVMAPSGGVDAIIAELLDNARRAATTPAMVQVRIDDDGPDADAWVLRIDDDGPGIPPSALESLREPFGRVVLPSHPGERSGLGLPMVDAIASAAGGRLQLEPSPLGGLRAIVRLPKAAAP